LDRGNILTRGEKLSSDQWEEKTSPVTNIVKNDRVKNIGGKKPRSVSLKH